MNDIENHLVSGIGFPRDPGPDALERAATERAEERRRHEANDEAWRERVAWAEDDGLACAWALEEYPGDTDSWIGTRHDDWGEAMDDAVDWVDAHWRTLCLPR